MFGSVIYQGSSSINAFDPGYFQFVKIFFLKVIVLLALAIFTQIINEQVLSMILTIVICMEFYFTRHIARTMVQIYWYIDTSGEQDQIIYQANLTAPQSKYEATFWYSFILYLIMLSIFAVIVLDQAKLSLFCAILIGICCTIANFYTFGKIINLRNEGILKKISDEVIPDASAIKMPLIHQSKLDRRTKLGIKNIELKSNVRFVNNPYERTSMIKHQKDQDNARNIYPHLVSHVQQYNWKMDMQAN